MPTLKPLTLLHVSDIQVQGVDEQRMLDSLLSDLRKLTYLYGLHPQIIIASGDLAQTGDKLEFERVSKFVNVAAKQLGLETKDVIIVPGNHDINRPACEKLFADSPTEPMPPYNVKWENFIDFFEKFYGGGRPRDSMFTISQPWSLYEFPKINTVFAGLNSTWDEGHLKEHWHGRIGHEQLEWFENKLREYKDRQWLRVAVLHHNIITVVRDDSYLYDRNDFFKSILPLVNMVFHGHTHQGIDDNKDGIPVLSTGSAAVAEGARPPEVPNQYQIVQIWPHHYQKWARSYSIARQDWIGDCSVSTSGNLWYERKTHAFKLIDAAFPRRDDEFSQQARGFIEAGDSETAIAILSRKRQQVSDTDVLDYFSLKQKFGVYDEEDLVLLDAKIAEIDPKDHAKSLALQVVRLKLHSQQEEFAAADALYTKLIGSDLALVKRRGIIHRQAIYRAISEGFDVAEPIFLKAKQISDGPDARLPSGAKNEHSLLTTKVLQIFAEFFCSQEAANREATAIELKRAQEGYLAAEYAYGIGQAFPLKSAIQALFAEAAVLLYNDLDNLKGWSRLFAANLLTSRYVIKPYAEGYSEQLSMIHVANGHFWADREKNHQQRKDLRDLLKLAMFSGNTERREFLDKYVDSDARYRVLLPMAEVLELIPPQNPRPGDWQVFRDFLDDVDQHTAYRA